MKQTKTELATENARLRKENDLLTIALNGIMDQTNAALAGKTNPDFIRVGDFTLDGIKITAHLVGPKRANGGTVILTQRVKAENSIMRSVFLLDDLSNNLQNANTDYSFKLRELIGKAVSIRNDAVVLEYAGPHRAANAYEREMRQLIGAK